MRALVLALAVLSGCRPLVCTEVGCIGTLTLNVQADGAPVSIFSGTVTVGTQTFTVDCGSGAENAPEVACGDGKVTFTLDGSDETDVAVEWSFDGSDGADTAGAAYMGSGTFTPEWTSAAPNGEACGPVCWGAEGTVELEALD